MCEENRKRHLEESKQKMASIIDLATSGEEEQERREEDRGQSDQERN